MPTQYMLDTNILSDAIKNHSGVVANRIEQILKMRGNTVCTSIIVSAELRYGAEKKGSMALSGNVERVLQAIEILPLAEPADTEYARLRADLEKRGTIIGTKDLLIAAHALATRSILVTDNTREFIRVKGLAIENWLRK